MHPEVSPQWGAERVVGACGRRTQGRWMGQPPSSQAAPRHL